MEYNPASSADFPYSYYVNGNNGGYGWEGAPPNDGGPIIIGGQGGTSILADSFFIGQVDEVAFYTRALSTTEVTNLYVAGFPGVTLTPPAFTTLPQSQNAFVGENVTFSAAAVGTSPISLQWKQNGIDLPFQTNSTLTVSNVVLGNTNLYSVVASNTVGFAASPNVTITVTYPPSFANLTNGFSVASDV